MDGYDFDGTVLRGVVPQHPSDVIITGRPYHDHKVTLRQLKLLGLSEYLVWFNPVEPEEVSPYTSALHKSNIVIRIGVDMFYEDSIFQALFIEMATGVAVQLVQTADLWGKVVVKPLQRCLRAPEGAFPYPHYIPLVGKRTVSSLHKIVWEGVYGEVPFGYYIAHKDGNLLHYHLNNLCLQANKGVAIPSGWITNTDGEPFARNCSECNTIKTIDLFEDALGEVCRECRREAL